MKIVCEACQAKYSISDDKVQGKAFKIRCKKCGHIIVVRSSGAHAIAPSVEAPPAVGAAAPAPDTIWHVVVDGEQVGPVSGADVRARLARGEISGDTYVWREGLSDWQKLSVVAELADGLAPFSPKETEQGTFGVQQPTTVYPPGTAEYAFTAAAPASGSEVDVFAAPTMVNQGSQDLFRSPAAPAPAASSGFGGFITSGAALGGAVEDLRPRASGNGASAPSNDGLTGQRHENSVLFSLSNLEALAAPPQATNAVPRPGVSAPTEGSGLIDIRSMAAMTLGAGAGATEGGAPSSDLPAFGGPQFSPIAPVLLPLAAPTGPSKWLYGLLIAGIAVAGVLAFAFVKILTRPVVVPAITPPSEIAAVPPAPAAAAPAPAVAAQPAEPPTTAPPANEENLPPREESKVVAAKTPDTKPARGGKAAKRGGQGARASASRAPAVAAGTTAAASKPEPAAADKPKGGSALDDLLQSALGGSKKPSAGRPRDEETDTAPKKAPVSLGSLQRTDMVSGMQGVTSKVKDCYNQYKVPGVAMVKVGVKGGRVSSAHVSGKFAGTPTGHCVEAAVKSARFPQTEPTSFDYPFPLR